MFIKSCPICNSNASVYFDGFLFHCEACPHSYSYDDDNYKNKYRTNIEDLYEEEELEEELLKLLSFTD